MWNYCAVQVYLYNWKHSFHIRRRTEKLEIVVGHGTLKPERKNWKRFCVHESGARRKTYTEHGIFFNFFYTLWSPPPIVSIAKNTNIYFDKTREISAMLLCSMVTIDRGERLYYYVITKLKTTLLRSIGTRQHRQNRNRPTPPAPFPPHRPVYKFSGPHKSLSSKSDGESFSNNITDKTIKPSRTTIGWNIFTRGIVICLLSQTARF